jgi:hypothetical protein
MQRAVTAVAKELSFGKTVEQIKEHYRFALPESAVREITLHHARQVGELVYPEQQTDEAVVCVAQMDGSLVPTLAFKEGKGDKRKRRLPTEWREAKLCSAHVVGKAEAVFGVTMEDAATAGTIWNRIVRSQTATYATHIHALGDGAPWIVDQFQTHFGGYGTFTVDFFHVSKYLAAAGEACHCSPDWLAQQQRLLKENQVGKVLRNLRRLRPKEPVPDEVSKVESAHRYIRERKRYLDYQGARRRKLPIGSGEVEGAHRSQLQARLKLSGAKWLFPNAHAMARLKVMDANNRWEDYWAKTCTIS